MELHSGTEIMCLTADSTSNGWMKSRYHKYCICVTWLFDKYEEWWVKVVWWFQVKWSWSRLLHLQSSSRVAMHLLVVHKVLELRAFSNVMESQQQMLKSSFTMTIEVSLSFVRLGREGVKNLQITDVFESLNRESVPFPVQFRNKISEEHLWEVASSMQLGTEYLQRQVGPKLQENWEEEGRKQCDARLSSANFILSQIYLTDTSLDSWFTIIAQIQNNLTHLDSELPGGAAEHQWSGKEKALFSSICEKERREWDTKSIMRWWVK